MSGCPKCIKENIDSNIPILPVFTKELDGSFDEIVDVMYCESHGIVREDD